MATEKAEDDQSQSSSSSKEVLSTASSADQQQPVASTSRVIDLTHSRSPELDTEEHGRRKRRRVTFDEDIVCLSAPISREHSGQGSSTGLALPSRPAHQVISLLNDGDELDNEENSAGPSRPPPGTPSWSRRLSDLGGMIARNMPWTSATNLEVVDSPPLQRASGSRQPPQPGPSNRGRIAVRGGIARRGLGNYHAPGQSPAAIQRRRHFDENWMDYDPNETTEMLLQRIYARRAELDANVAPPPTTSTVQPKFDPLKSHPKKLAKGFRRNVVPPESIIVLDEPEDGEEGEYEEIPVCAACDAELFLGPTAEPPRPDSIADAVPENQENAETAEPTEAPTTRGRTSKAKKAAKAPAKKPAAKKRGGISTIDKIASLDASRACVLRCGHLICAMCASKAKTRHYSKRPARGKNSKTKGKGKKAQYPVDLDDTLDSVDLAPPADSTEWIGCPVNDCDGGGTAWAKKLRDPDGVWEVFI